MLPPASELEAGIQPSVSGSRNLGKLDSGTVRHALIDDLGIVTQHVQAALHPVPLVADTNLSENLEVSYLRLIDPYGELIADSRRLTDNKVKISGQPFF